MTKVQKFLFDFDFDDVRLMEEIDLEKDQDEHIANAEYDLDLEPGTEPEPEILSFSEDELAAAREEGFATGKENGVQETLDGIENSISQSLDNIATEISGITQRQIDFNIKTERDALELTLNVCRKLFPTLSEEGKLNEVTMMTKSMLNQILTEPSVTIYTNTDIIDRLKEKIEPYLAMKGYQGTVSFKEDNSLPVSGCRVEWLNGDAERNPEATLQEIEQAITGSLEDQSVVGDSEALPETNGQTDTTLDSSGPLENQSGIGDSEALAETNGQTDTTLGSAGPLEDLSGAADTEALPAENAQTNVALENASKTNSSSNNPDLVGSLASTGDYEGMNPANKISRDDDSESHSDYEGATNSGTHGTDNPENNG